MLEERDRGVLERIATALERIANAVSPEDSGAADKLFDILDKTIPQSELMEDRPISRYQLLGRVVERIQERYILTEKPE